MKIINTKLFCLSLLVVSLSGCGGGSSSNNDDNNTNTKPSLSLNGPNPQYQDLNSSFVNQGASATDVEDGDISATVSQSNNVNTAIAGCYQQSYQVTDSSGNQVSTERRIFVGTDAERHSPNTPPVVAETSVSIFYTTTSTVNVLENAFDADCDPLTISFISEPDIGTATLNADNTITFDPLGNVGSHFFIYTVSDAYGGSDTAGFTIGTTDPDDGNDNWPNVTGEMVSTSVNTSILIDVLANDFDADGDILVLDGVDDPQHGTIEKQNGKVFYTPDLNYTGTDNFYYGVHDNHGHNGSALVEITITE